ncbi:Uma2 family endonuclease [Streptomyces sp. NPDC059837]|uniref:Uma2 family endonuclease n=1 Tax=unclassified Streptomyces TaxID=2593676 RepID=UPI00224ED414|nr:MULTISPECIES: Uma2 family endonuclease [unclassified Streptomyces]MCX4400703.1 Uma2 family endonuclease [Streptomyces sp. NBC_01764]MCX5184669.1 Uma2 family endonuclease [Streptomyces sp. NBC_00268]
MSAEPITEPVMTQQDPIDLLIAIEEASQAPIRPEYVEGMAIVPPQPNHKHNHGAFELAFQFRSAGHLVGMGNGYRAARKDGTTTSLLIPDFYVLRRDPTELDDSYLKAHRGWYPIDMIALVGEVTSTNHETDTGPKLRTYAAAGVPVYVLINRNAKTAHCYTDPVLPGDDPTEAYYDSEIKVDLGDPLPLPAPYPILQTAPFLEG